LLGRVGPTRVRDVELEFRLLGPVEVLRADEALNLGGERQRALLALLLLRAGETVSADVLLEAVFGSSSLNALQAAISRLRRSLGDEGSALVTRAPGYMLDVPPERVDVARFEHRCAEGSAALAAGDPAAAAQTLRGALAEWRGPALGDLATLEFVQGEIRRLEELRLTAISNRIEASQT
jgi:DNA-binding SARP family transcriptional activator